MLAKYWRLHCYWVGNQTLTYDSGARIAVRLSPWKISSGSLSYGITITEDFGFGAGDAIATGEMESIGSTNDNTSNLYWGIKGFVSLIADVSGTTGTLYIYLDESDDNTNWPGGATDFDATNIMYNLRLVGTVYVNTDAVDEGNSANFEF